ncbi:MAG: DUF488 family protein [Deltaproteobacteria bacterium]|nr:DUF488 family protein [Deltaproteobacteria bacterium]
MIKTKSIYSQRSEDDGVRVLVTRYWPRGVKKDAIDRWFRDLGPTPELIKLWKSGGIAWEGFRKEYLDEYRSLDKSALFEELKDFIKCAVEGAGSGGKGTVVGRGVGTRTGRGDNGGRVAAGEGCDVTLLCTCRMDERCHRDILKELIETPG